jgi:hypothetical protein
MIHVKFDDDDRTVCAICGKSDPCKCVSRDKNIRRDTYTHQQRLAIVTQHQRSLLK